MADVGEIRARLVLDADRFNRNMDSARTRMESTGRSAQRASKNIKLIETAALGVGSAVALGIGASIKTAADFEKKLSDIKSVSGATSEEMGKLADLAKEAGKSTSFSASQAAAGIEELIKAGLSVEQIMDGGLKGALDLAAAGGIELADAAEIASTALNAFKSDNLKVVDAANLLAGAANASATDVGELKFGLSAVSAVAAGVGMSFADTSAALAVFAQNGLKGSDAGTSLKTLLMNLVPSGKRARETMHELGIAMADGTNKFYDAEGKIKSLAEISDVLRTALIKLNPKERGEALKDMFGSDAIRAGNILFKEGAKGVEAMASAMSKITAAETAATKLDNFHGSVEALKGSLETLGIEIGEDFLPLLTDFAREITNVLSSMDSADVANLKAGLSFAGVASAIGLAGTSLAKLGIAARGLFLAMGGPVALTVGALALLGGAIAGAVVKNREMEAARLKNIEAGFKEVNALDESIKKYDALKSKSKLTNDEFGRYLDIQSELKKTSDPTVISKLKDEMAKLQERSGLSNKELSDMVGLNDDLIEKVPGASKAITDQGNAVLENTKKLKEYSAEKLNSLYQDLDLERLKKETEYKDLLEEEKNLIKDRKDEETKLETLLGKRATAQSKERDEQRILNEMKKEGSGYTEAEVQQQQVKVKLAHDDVSLAQSRVEKQADVIQGTKEELKDTHEKLKKLDEIKQKMAQIVLKQAGLTSEKGKELNTITKEIGKLEEKKKKLQDTTPVAQRNTAEYKEAVSAIQSQINKLEGAKSKVEQIINKADEMNTKLGKSVNKSVSVVVKTEISAANKRLIDPQNNGPVKSKGFSPIGLYHTGGITGRGQMPMLHTGGLASQFANAPSHNEIDVRLLRNEMVLTESQQANLMRLIDAGITNNGNGSSRVVAETDPKLIGAIKELASQSVKIEMDGREVAKATVRHTQNELDTLTRKQDRLRGKSY